MNLTPKNQELLVFLDRTEKFSSLFREEESPLSENNKKKAVTLSPFTKSLDSIVFNLAEAMKALTHWDNLPLQNEIDTRNLMSKNSSVMISFVDYLESQHSLQDKSAEKLGLSDHDQIISLYKYKGEKKSSEVAKIFINRPIPITTFKVHEKSSIWIECQKSKIATITEIYDPPQPYVKTILEHKNRQEGIVLFAKLLESHRSTVEINLIEYKMYLLIDRKLRAPIKELEPIQEEFDEKISNIINPQESSSNGDYQIFGHEDDGIDDNLEFFDADDFRSKNEEVICYNIIANLKDNKKNSVTYALTLLDDLVKENQEKKILNPKKIKKSLHELQEAFGLFEKHSKIDLTTSSEAKDVKCFSDILKVLESVTHLVQLQLKEKRMRKGSFMNYESAVSVMKGEDFEIQPRNLREEMTETFSLLKAYSEKAKRLIKEFRTRPKMNEIRREDINKYFCKKNRGSFDSYFKENVENIEF